MSRLTSFMAMSALALLLQDAHSRPVLDIEADPTDFILGGYRLHAGYIHDHLRFDMGILSVEIPRAIQGNDRFKYEISGVVARIDYLFGSYPGWFAGMEGTQMRNTYTHIPTGASTVRHPFLLAARLGYRFEFWEHLTVTPWVGMGALLKSGGDYVVGKDKFEVPILNVFPTVHVGWAF